MVDCFVRTVRKKDRRSMPWAWIEGGAWVCSPRGTSQPPCTHGELRAPGPQARRGGHWVRRSACSVTWLQRSPCFCGPCSCRPASGPGTQSGLCLFALTPVPDRRVSPLIFHPSTVSSPSPLLHLRICRCGRRACRRCSRAWPPTMSRWCPPSPSHSSPTSRWAPSFNLSFNLLAMLPNWVLGALHRNRLCHLRAGGLRLKRLACTMTHLQRCQPACWAPSITIALLAYKQACRGSLLAGLLSCCSTAWPAGLSAPSTGAGPMQSFISLPPTHQPTIHAPAAAGQGDSWRGDPAVRLRGNNAQRVQQAQQQPHLQLACLRSLHRRRAPWRQHPLLIGLIASSSASQFDCLQLFLSCGAAGLPAVPCSKAGWCRPLCGGAPRQWPSSCRRPAHLCPILPPARQAGQQTTRMPPPPPNTRPLAAAARDGMHFWSVHCSACAPLPPSLPCCPLLAPCRLGLPLLLNNGSRLPCRALTCARPPPRGMAAGGQLAWGP